MRQAKARNYAIWIFISLLCVAAPGFSLPSDQEQVMHVTADSANLNQLTHRGTYTGQVEFIQGTTNLRAQNALTQANAKNQLILAVANGSKDSQAHFWTQTDPQKPIFHAYADIIKYHPLSHLIELIGHARVEQGTNSLSAAKITYDTIKHQVISQGDKKARTVIIIYPEKKSS